ncbi:MAG TPA: S8 family peptidase [Lachnospiraceae bacterium]|nr:S8 family peptidase [Lachnospiraceae bacterium]
MLDAECSNRIMSEEYADFIFQNNKIPESILSTPDFCYYIINNIYTVTYLDIKRLPDNIIHTYSYSIFPSCFGLMNLDSLEDAGVSQIQVSAFLDLTGQGVLVGIVDTGIDYTHQAFKNPDGTTRIISIWDQTINDTLSSPDGFYYGTEYTQDQINFALSSTDPLSIVPSRDEIGHGTTLAGIAAGNRNISERFTGVAQDVKIVVVKLKRAKRYLKDFFFIPEDALCYQENDIMLGIKYLLEIAKRLQRPISICIGLGTSQGPHNSTSALGNYLSSIASQQGVGVSVAAGNEGNTNHHFSGIADVETGYITVELNVGADTKGFSMELWGNSPNVFSIDLLSPTGRYTPRIPARLKETRTIDFLFESTRVYIDYELVESLSGNQLILIRFQNPMEGIWRFRVYSSINIEPKFNIWLPIVNFLEKDTYFLVSDPFITLTIPANTLIPIIATCYNYVNQNLFVEASRGYAVNDLINPSFAAPGVNMVVPAQNNDYTIASGTSISAGFTTGVVALILEWGIVKGNKTQLDTLQVKNFLIRGARRVPTMVYPNRDWGYGVLDVYNAFRSLTNL